MAVDPTRDFKPINIALLTVSDTRGAAEDTSGDILAQRIEDAGHRLAARTIVRDDAEAIAGQLNRWIDDPAIDAVISTGGTGLTGRDVTPEATEAVCDKILDGFGEQMRAVSLKVVPTAILSRQIAGIRGKSLIVNLPGKPSAIRDCLLAVFPAIPYCIDLIEGPFLTTHERVVKAFRPKK